MKKTLLLVDGSSYLYRAYYAMPNLRNAQGDPTGALYGVINMMRKISQDYKADYLACVFDAKGKTFRNDLYEQYKANRPSMPEDLALQIEPIHEAIKAMGWPVVCIPGVEADDVIATLADKAKKHGIYSIISTGDKDMAQLVDENITLINTMNQETLTTETVKEKFGVWPSQIIDYLMLIGDTSDNVPGVPKVGPKTAAKWLDKYKTLDCLVENAAEIKGVVGENLRNHLDQFELMRQLITIQDDCNLDEIKSLTDLEPRKIDKEKLITIYDQYGFKTWLREITEDEQAIPSQDIRIEQQHVPEAPKEVHYEMVNTHEQLKNCLEAIHEAKWVALDTETTSLNPMNASLIGLSLSIAPGQGWYIPLAHQASMIDEQLDKKETLNTLQHWLEDKKENKILQNAKYDMHILANEGIALKGILHDTMLMAYVLKSNQRVGMDDLAMRYLARETTTYESICGKGRNAIGFDEVPIEQATQYACEDTDITFQLAQVMLPLIEENEGFNATYQLEMQLMPVLCTMERNGVKIDPEVLNKQSAVFEERLQNIEKQAFEIVGEPFNLNSPKQLAEILFEKMELPIVKKTPKGAPSTNEEVLSQLAEDYPLAKLILEHRSLAKLKSTYTDKLAKLAHSRTGRVHTSYSQASVVTGRLASSDPNLQNIPVRTEEGKRIREAFVAENNAEIISADYSQIELRVMAHLSEDANLQKAFAEGKDIHQATAAEIFNIPLEEVTSDQRRSAKAINFGLIYGMGAFGLAKNLDISRQAAQTYIDRYFSRYPGVASYMEMIRHRAQEQGYVETVFGRRLWFDEIKGAKGPRKAAAERAAINAPMQGTAADLIKKAMVQVQGFLEDEKLASQMIMQVHDELVLEVPLEEKALILKKLPEIMCQVADLKVPLIADVGVGENWREAH